jgi:hypothetical protein
MVLLPYESSFSVVVGLYGHERIEPRDNLGLHQFQDGRWILVRPVAGAFLLVPTVVG